MRVNRQVMTPYEARFAESARRARRVGGHVGNTLMTVCIPVQVRYLTASA